MIGGGDRPEAVIRSTAETDARQSLKHAVTWQAQRITRLQPRRRAEQMVEPKFAVIVYGGAARFSGRTHFTWACPAVGDTHKFILFLAQKEQISIPSLAITELESYGFVEIDLQEGRPIAVESLNNPKMAHFRKHYEGAIAEGSSIVWYA